MSTHRHIPTKGHAAPDPEPTMNQDNKNTKPPRGPLIQTQDARLATCVLGVWALWSALVVYLVGWQWEAATHQPHVDMPIGFYALYTTTVVIAFMVAWISNGTE